MSTRDDLREQARSYGWDLDDRRLPWLDTFIREVKAPGTKLAKLADSQGFFLREEVLVTYSAGTHKARLLGGLLRTPHDQAAIDGNFVSASDRAEGVNKKGQIIAWLASTRNYGVDFPSSSCHT